MKLVLLALGSCLLAVVASPVDATSVSACATLPAGSVCNGPDSVSVPTQVQCGDEAAGQSGVGVSLDYCV